MPLSVGYDGHVGMVVVQELVHFPIDPNLKIGVKVELWLNSEVRGKR